MVLSGILFLPVNAKKKKKKVESVDHDHLHAYGTGTMMNSNNNIGEIMAIEAAPQISNHKVNANVTSLLEQEDGNDSSGDDNDDIYSNTKTNAVMSKSENEGGVSNDIDIKANTELHHDHDEHMQKKINE